MVPLNRADDHPLYRRNDMASRRFRGMIGAFIAGSLIVSSTAASASTPISSVQQVDPWAVLTAMSGGAPAAAMCGAAAVAAAAQSPTGCVLPALDVVPAPLPPVAAAPVPIPPLPAPLAAFGITPLILVPPPISPPAP